MMADTFYDRIKEGNQTPDTTETTETTTTEPVVATEETTEAQAPETKTETTTTEEPTPKEEKSFDVSSINDYYGTSFESADSLKEIFESQSKYKDFDSQLATREQELASAHEKYNALLDAIDPEKVFSNKDVLALDQLQEKYPNADIGMMSQIRKTDLSSLDKLEALVMIDKLNVPSKVPDSIRKAEILRGLGIEEEDISELSEQDTYRIEREYTSKSKQLEEIKEFQPELTKFDFEGERSSRQQKLEEEKKSLLGHNEKALKIILDSYKETKSTYRENDKDRAFSFQVDNNFKDKFFTDILTRITDSGTKLTTDNANAIAQDIDNLYWLENRHNIVNDAIKQALSQEKEATHRELNSDSPTNKTEAPPVANKVPQTVMDSYRKGNVKPR